MSDDIAYFLKPRLVGTRFEGASIPLEVLRDLAVLEEMLIEVAKWSFLQQHDRKRSPRGFTEGVSLKLVGIEDGSAKPLIQLVMVATASLLPGAADTRLTYFEQARDLIVGVVHAAETNSLKTFDFPSGSLGYFDRLGRSLKPGESIQLVAPTGGVTATLNAETRRKLLLFSPDVSEFSEDWKEHGSVPEFDQDKRTFTLQLLDGKKVTLKVASQHYQNVMDAFTGYKGGTKVLIQGIATFNRNANLSGFQSIEHITLLEPLDVTCRLKELSTLRKGWLDGHGDPIDAEALSWLVDAWNSSYDEEMPLPHAYPTPNGGVQFEWSLRGNELTLEVQLPTKKALWNDFEAPDEVELDLGTIKGWEFVNQRVKAISQGAK